MHRRHERRVARDVTREFWARVALRNQWRTLPPVVPVDRRRRWPFVVAVAAAVVAGVLLGLLAVGALSPRLLLPTGVGLVLVAALAEPIS